MDSHHKVPPLAGMDSHQQAPPSLGMDAEQFRAAAHAAVDEIITYYTHLPSLPPLSSVPPGYLAPLLPLTAPTLPEPWSAIAADIPRLIHPGLTHWQSPRFMAFFPASSTYPAMLGELYSAAFTAPAFNWLCSPAVTELETVVLDWVARMLNLPGEFESGSVGGGGGVIQGSASEAVVTVMVGARERYLRNKVKGEGMSEEGDREKWEARVGALRGRLVALGSDQAHSATQKGANIAGTRYRAVETRREDGFAMTGERLRRTIEGCVRDGLEPFYATTTMGTTATCAVDRFEEIAEVARDYPELWIHVDAAYAGAALVCEEYQHHAAHFAAFDSFDMNMHNCLFVKHRRDLTSALSITPTYLRNTFSDSGLVTDYRDWQIPLGRRFRALKIWFVLRTYGVDGLKAHIRKHVALGETFHSLLLTRPDLFRVLVPPAFALAVFTIVPPRAPNPAAMQANRLNPSHEAYTNDFAPDADAQAVLRANEITKEVYELVNSRGEIFVTSTVCGGIYAIRVVSANPLAEEKYLREAFEIFVRTAQEVLDRRADEANGMAKGQKANGQDADGQEATGVAQAQEANGMAKGEKTSGTAKGEEVNGVAKQGQMSP